MDCMAWSIKKIFILLFFIFTLISVSCKKKDKSNESNALLLLLFAASQQGDGCNLKTSFAVCVPPGIGGE